MATIGSVCFTVSWSARSPCRPPRRERVGAPAVFSATHTGRDLAGHRHGGWSQKPRTA